MLLVDVAANTTNLNPKPLLKRKFYVFDVNLFDELRIGLATADDIRR